MKFAKLFGVVLSAAVVVSVAPASAFELGPVLKPAGESKAEGFAAAAEEWIASLQLDDLPTQLGAKWAANDKAAAALKQHWAGLRAAHAKFDYRGWLNGKHATGPAPDAGTFTFGGHAYDHLHVQWSKTAEGWRIRDVWMCR